MTSGGQRDGQGPPEGPFLFRSWNSPTGCFFSTSMLLAGNRLGVCSSLLRQELKFRYKEGGRVGGGVREKNPNLKGPALAIGW